MVRALPWNLDEIRWRLPIGVVETELLGWRSPQFDSRPSGDFQPLTNWLKLPVVSALLPGVIRLVGFYKTNLLINITRHTGLARYRL